MPSNTGSTPTQTAKASPTAIPAPEPQLTGEQRAAVEQHDLARAKESLVFELADTLLPLLNQQVSVAALRYYLGLGVDQVLGSPNGLILQGRSRP